MSKISQRRALLLAAIVPAMLVSGCAGGSGSQAMKGAASPMTPTDTMVPPEETDTGMETASPTDTNGAGQARSVVQGFFDALKSGNADQVVGAFADDAWVAVEGEPTAKGSEAIRTLFQDKLKAANGMGKATHSIEDAQALGDEGAVVRSTSKHEGEEYRELFVLMQDGGEWKITQFMNNGTA